MKLRCENLVKKYGIRTVVKGVSMEISQGEIVGFLGPNGAGKTTSFYMITGQIVPNGGRVYLDDEDITELPMYKRAQKGIGYLPQEASVFRKMSVEDNIMSVMEIAGIPKDVRNSRLERLIEEINLSKVRKSLGIQLSGDERRRCELARALALVGGNVPELLHGIAMSPICLVMIALALWTGIRSFSKSMRAGK